MLEREAICYLASVPVMSAFITSICCSSIRTNTEEEKFKGKDVEILI